VQKLVFENLSTAEIKLFRQTTSLIGYCVALDFLIPWRDSSARTEEPFAREHSLYKFYLVDRAVRIASVRYRSSFLETDGTTKPRLL